MNILRKKDWIPALWTRAKQSPLNCRLGDLNMGILLLVSSLLVGLTFLLSHFHPMFFFV